MENQALLKAVRLLESGEYTCVLCFGEHCLTTQQRGVKPLVQWLKKEIVPRGFSAADRVVGKATAFLYCILGAKAVFAGVMSHSAKTVLEANGIYTCCTQLTDYIENRSKDGICPFEAAVLEIDEPEQALNAIYSKLNELGIS